MSRKHGPAAKHSGNGGARCLESAPVPGPLEALRQAAHAGIIWPLRNRGSLNRLCRGRSAAVRALAVSSAGAEMLPLAEGAVATITCTVPVTLGMEARKLVKADLVARVLCAEDATTLAAVVTALEESKGLLARRR